VVYMALANQQIFLKYFNKISNSNNLENYMKTGGIR
jgi:hypothetical protein